MHGATTKFTDLFGLFWYDNGPRGSLYVYDVSVLTTTVCTSSLSLLIVSLHMPNEHMHIFTTVGDAKSTSELNI